MSRSVLGPARGLLVTSEPQGLGFTVNTNNAKSIFNGVFSDKVDLKGRGYTGRRHLVVALNKLIWGYI